MMLKVLIKALGEVTIKILNFFRTIVLARSTISKIIDLRIDPWRRID
jgi:hypothetical protein